MNLIEVLNSAASRWPEKPALVDGQKAASYRELEELSTTLASRLQVIPVRAGSRIGLRYPNSIAYVALTFALWRLEAIVVPIPLECSDEDAALMAVTLQLEGVITAKNLGESVPLDPNSYFTRWYPAQAPDNHGLNIAFIRFTSGTTFARKGVVLTHETIHDRLKAANTGLAIGATDTVMWCLPMSHHFLVTVVLYLSQGATIALARHTLARPFLEAVNRCQGTVLYAAPFHYALLARDQSGLELPSVRLAVSTTCQLPEEVALAFHQRFGLPLTQALGLIELGLVCINVDQGAARWDSVGRPLPQYAVNLRHADHAGCGELMVSGPGFFDAYAAPWTWREQLMPDGWFATGDIGRMDSDGYVYLVGRKTAVINVAGRKVFPEEIETILNRHPAVRESRVYGTAHPHLGETIEAEVVLGAGVEMQLLRDFCRVHLSSEKVPGQIHAVNQITKTAATGKILRQSARPVS